VRLLGRLAVTEAQQRRVFFEKQLRDTKENLVKADLDMQKTQERSGMIVLDKQAEAILTNMARLRAGIVEREVQLRVLRTAATEQNPDVIRLNSELSGLRAELVRMESSAGAQGSVVDIPAGKIPEAAAAYIRARREVKFQETLLESMLRQYEIAKLDEAKEGPAVQQVDVALAPDRRSKPLRTLIIVGGLLLGLLGSAAYVVVRRYRALVEPDDTQRNAAWRDLLRAWRWK
jgi:capsule polysaccharide export protein KpsE/RkpR